MNAQFIQTLNAIRARARVLRMSKAELGHLRRAAARALGAGFKIVDIDLVSFEGREYFYSFEHGRFYG